MAYSHRTSRFISSARHDDQLVDYLDFQFATPPTAFAWAAIVRHCGLLVVFWRVNYYIDDFEQFRARI